MNMVNIRSDLNGNVFIKGVDISTLIEEEQCGAKYYDNGVEGDALEILNRYGANYVRLRLWNDPYSEDGKPYGAGTNDIKKTIELSRRAIKLGMGVLLDLHYSDFWADPGKQIVPKVWRSYSVDELESTIYEFTRECLLKLKEENVLPTMIQIGNEITNGLLWPTGKKPEFDNIARYVSAGIKAAKEIAPEAEIMIHLDNGGFNSMYVEWFDNYVKRGEDFDIIGLSYYPFWHGTLEELSFNMEDMARRYGKKIAIAEVSMGFSMEDYRIYEVPDDVIKRISKEMSGNEIDRDAFLSYYNLKNSVDDNTQIQNDNIMLENIQKWINENLIGKATRENLIDKIPYPMTPQGQSDFMKDIMKRVDAVEGGMGFFYWEPAWIPVPGCGWATKEALEYTGEKGLGGNEWANQALFDYNGNVLPALETIRDY